MSVRPAGGVDAWVTAEDLEGIAEDILRESLCEEPPVDALEVASCCGMEVVCSDVGEAILMGGAIFVPRRAGVGRVQKMVAHEIGHWGAARAGIEDTEEVADFIGAAILVPRRALVRELRAGWDLEALRRRHVYAPASLIADRIARVRQATAAVYDGQRLRRRTGPRQPIEVELRDEALATGLAVRVDDRTGAWPIDVGSSWRRVVVLIDTQS